MDVADPGIDQPRRPASSLGESQRKALLPAIKASGRSDREIAAAAGLSKSVISNFRTGKTEALSLQAWTGLCGVLPGLKADLAGRAAPRTAAPPMHQGKIQIRARAAAGLLQKSYELPSLEEHWITLPVSPADIDRGGYGVRIAQPGHERIHDEIVFCVPIGHYQGVLKPEPGRPYPQVVVERTTTAGIEVTVRELRITANEALLWMLSEHPDHQVVVRVPYHPARPLKPWRFEGARYLIVAVVVWGGGPR